MYLSTNSLFTFISQIIIISLYLLTFFSALRSYLFYPQVIHIVLGESTAIRRHPLYKLSCVILLVYAKVPA